jgi:predicted aminopeptidase
VSASKKDSFTFHLWWFPIVGEVPYKGFFEKEDAISQARDLEARGFETWVRGTDAFSTLGWFNDPVLSTTLKRPIVQIANTVIHETLHSTIWIPNHVDFNESLANFVGTEGAVQFFENRLHQCREASGCNTAAAEETFNASLRDRDAEYEVSDVVAALYHGLTKIYSSYAPLEVKMKLREEFFNRTTAEIRKAHPGLRVLKKINNGEIAQLYVYTRGLKDFDTLFTKSQKNWQIFLEEIKAIRDKSEENQVSPFVILKERIT